MLRFITDRGFAVNRHIITVWRGNFIAGRISAIYAQIFIPDTRRARSNYGTLMVNNAGLSL